MELTKDEAEFLLELLRQLRGGVNFEVEAPDKAIRAAQTYKTIVDKLKATAAGGQNGET